MKAPIEPPTSGTALQQFELQRVDYMAADAGGRVGGVQAGFPLWSGVWTIGTIGADRSDAFRAFLTKLRGATRRFLGRDLGRPYPKAYPTGFTGMTRAGGGSFGGAALSWSDTLTLDGDCKITLNGLPSGFQMAPGDYIGFRWTATEPAVAGLTWHTLVRAVEAGTADETGTLADLVCEPPIPSVVPSGATAYLDRPAAVMALVIDRSSLDAIDRRLAVRGGTITGIQDLRA